MSQSRRHDAPAGSARTRFPVSHPTHQAIGKQMEPGLCRHKNPAGHLDRDIDVPSSSSALSGASAGIGRDFQESASQVSLPNSPGRGMVLKVQIFFPVRTSKPRMYPARSLWLREPCLPTAPRPPPRCRGPTIAGELAPIWPGFTVAIQPSVSSIFSVVTEARNREAGLRISARSN